MASENHSQENGVQNGMEVAQVAVVMVPLPAQGHLNQLLHLSRLVSAYGIPIHFVGTTTHNRQAKSRVHGWDPSATTNFHFQDFPIPPFDSPLADPNATTKFPSQILPAFHASIHLREPVYSFVRKLSSTTRRIAVIYDSLMPYVVQDIYSISNAESYCFNSISAFSLYSFHWELSGKPALSTEAEILKEVPSSEGCFSPEFEKFLELQEGAKKFNSGDLYNANRFIEGFYLDLLAKEKTTGTDKLWAIGPFNPMVIPEKRDLNSHHKCLEWLDRQPLNSVIFVSFGSTSSFSDEQVKELAFGLEQSEQKFIWVLRDADKGDVFEGETRRSPLPEGFEKRVEGRGIIVRDWAPQLEILGHPSTGGFMSHCGWNSCTESISMGVPIAAWPMHSDQPRNAVLVTEVLKIGLEVRNWASRDKLVSPAMVENVVRRLMDSAGGEEMRKRAAELGDAVKQSVMEGGATHKEMDSFIAHISRQNISAQI
ncbi:zeatin O-glucosyltransferase-like [Olea europaea var. sylvestris]|uniref:Glycosyltransferase n=1 Tax=Olea europaea subsp. europaea TaxID=158383 RepID=A0A8S0UEZ3_OLEEU|nr:zeatin O-glucosyltransferase-like [Olea europaea var. sylvestris]XP_022853581.1 zeatin O-glucosyltransferase-like [Olea europaea var. sylvestris]CAA3016818.1 zeatin O-glucosyltransferase-like [Olea europaea subsp. europaea]